MNINEQMTWGYFKDILGQNPSLDLQFQYADDKKVNASYHITEIKQAPVTSVDCGGKMNAWTEIVVQLMEPANGNQLRPMKVRKALSIVEIVEKALPLNLHGIVKIEFGNADFDVRQMHPFALLVDGDELTVNLRNDTVQCKALVRGGSCGTPAEKTKLKLGDIKTDACCTPGGGCC